MTPLRAWKQHRLERRNAKVCAQIREHFRWFGYSLDDLSDEEMVERINAFFDRAADLFKAHAISMAETCGTLTKLATTLHNVHTEMLGGKDA